MREADWKALGTVATLEEEIEWLSCPLIRSWSEAWAHSQSRDHCRWRYRGWKRRHCQVQLEDCCAPYFQYHPSQRGSESKEDVEATDYFNLEDLPELGLEVICFLQGPVKSSEEENMKMPSPEPPIRVGEVGDLESLGIWNTQLVAGASHGSWSGWPWKAGMWGIGLFSTSKKDEWMMPGEEWPPGSTCTAMSLPEEFPSAAWLYLCLPGYLGNPAWEDSGTCPCPSVLGREGWSAYWRYTTPFGGECSRAPGRDEVLCLLLRWGCVWWHSSSGGNPHNNTQRRHNRECPAYTGQSPCEGSHYGHDHGAHCGEEASKQVPWLGETATPFQTCSCCWADSPFIERPEAKAS